MMIKRWMAGVLMICMMWAVTAGFATSYTAADPLTLPEKVSLQLEKGSGLKGSFVLKTEGSNETAEMLALFNQAEIQVRGIITDEGWHYYLYQTDEANNQWARTDLVGKDGAVYVKSDLLEGSRILMVPQMQTVLDTLSQGERVNPPFVSAAWNLLHMNGDEKTNIWTPLVQQLQERVETWLTPFASSPAVRQTEDGQTVMDLSYVIPVSALKKSILDGLDLIVQNQELMDFAAGMMTAEQRELYLNPYLRYYYEAALNSLDLSFDAVLSRTVSSLGKTLSTTIDLPLDERTSGWASLSLTAENGMQMIRLSRADRSLTLIWQEGSLTEDGQLTFWAADVRNDGEASRAVRVNLTRNRDTWEDEETGTNETYEYTIDIVHDTKAAEAPEETEFTEIQPIHGAATLHFYSKFAKSSPTYLEIGATLEQDGMTISAEGNFKSASPWVFSPFEIINAENVLKMSPEELVNIGAQWLSGAVGQIRPNIPEKLTAPEETITPEQTSAQETEGMPEVTPLPEEIGLPEDNPAPEAATEAAATVPDPENVAEPEETTETAGINEEALSAPDETEDSNGTETAAEQETESGEESEEFEEEDTSDWPEITASPDSDG